MAPRSKRETCESFQPVRRSKEVKGDKVVIRDQSQRKAEGRTPYRQPYTDPAHELEVHGNKYQVRLQDGRILPDVHLEDVLLVPEMPVIQKHNRWNSKKKTPSMMIEDQGVWVGGGGASWPHRSAGRSRETSEDESG